MPPRATNNARSGIFLFVISTIVSLTIAEMIAEKVLEVPEKPKTQIKILPAGRPDLAYVLPPNRSMVSMGVPFTTNELGLRDDPVIPKTDRIFRILCLGDSGTFGHGVPVEDTYPNVLEQRLQVRAGQSLKIDVINAGVMGYNLMNILASAETLIASLQPNVVTYMFVDNDLDDSFSAGPNGPFIQMDPLKPPDAPFFQNDFARLWKKRNPTPKGFFGSLGICRLVSKWLFPDTLNTVPLLNGSGPETRRRWKLCEERLQSLKATCESQGARFVVLQFGMRNRSELTHRSLRQICTTHSIPFASTLPIFDINTFFHLHSLRYDPHPNREAYLLIALRLDSFLQECGFLPEACTQPDKERPSFSERTDPGIEQQIEESVTSMPARIDLLTGDGIIGVLGGIGRKGYMARTCLFRLGGAGNQLVVEAQSLLASPDQPQTLSARIQDSSPTEPVPVSEAWSTLTFDIPRELENQVIEVELIAGGPVHIPTLAEREKGSAPYTVALRRMERIQGPIVP